MDKKRNRRNHQAPAPRIIVERVYIGKRDMREVFQDIAESAIREKVAARLRRP
ncbi:MAG: hypothetical protein ABF904_14825 [Ethanoligenens sp.]